MQISSIQSNQTRPSFGIKIEKNFIEKAHNYYNYRIIENKKRHIYAFNKKVEEFADYGYDEYVLDYEKRLIANNKNRHYLVVKRDVNGMTQKHAILKRGTLANIVDAFMNIDKEEFNRLMSK